MKKVLFAFLLGLVAPLVVAATLTAQWTKATTNVDGSAIPASGPGSVTTTVEYGTCTGTAFNARLGDVTVANTGLSAVTPDLGPGQYCFRAKHTNTFGIDSDWSTTVVRSVAAPKPNPPTITGFLN